MVVSVIALEPESAVLAYPRLAPRRVLRVKKIKRDHLHRVSQRTSSSVAARDVPLDLDRRYFEHLLHRVRAVGTIPVVRDVVRGHGRRQLYGGVRGGDVGQGGR